MYAIESPVQSVQGNDTFARSLHAWPHPYRSVAGFERAVEQPGWHISKEEVLQGPDIDVAFAGFCNPLPIDEHTAALSKEPCISPVPRHHSKHDAVHHHGNQHASQNVSAASAQKQRQRHFPFEASIIDSQHRNKLAHRPFGQFDLCSQPTSTLHYGVRNVLYEVENLQRHESLDLQQCVLQRDSPATSLDIHNVSRPNTYHQHDILAQAGKKKHAIANTKSHAQTDCQTGSCSPACQEGLHENQPKSTSLGVNASLVKRRIAKRDSARRMRAKKREQLDTLGIELQELLASKALLEDSLKEVDSDLPDLHRRLDATLRSAHETRQKNKALQQEAVMLQRIAAKMDCRLRAIMAPHMPCASSACI